ncbi:hypothetical protein FAZ69_27270 [Trinickia terrae]|uniref:Uncharacterized protein n=1 Tax=Trinickia terrae TaxID=2571161 RepID=A0A4U1HPE2_9BURK|nr:hypothetical protein [Trinickia terrae]TKC81667.1 hypothetical protein FAZ69_27270 [Trinickia terrae]
MGKKEANAARRVQAQHVVEAELNHLEWATRQPPNRMFDVEYWRRRLLAVQRQFELTLKQCERVEEILRRLDESEN